MNAILKKWLILSSAMLLTGNWADAQNQNSNRLQSEQFGLQRSRDEFKLGQRIEMLTKRLSLSADQIDKVKEIERHNLDEELRARERYSMANDTKGMQQNTRVGPNFIPSAEQRSLNGEFIRLRKVADDRIAGLLTEKQKLKFKGIRKREIQNMEDRMNGIRPGNQQINKRGENKSGKVTVIKKENQKFPKK